MESPTDRRKSQQKVLNRIPPSVRILAREQYATRDELIEACMLQVLHHAHGIAVFTIWRMGFLVSGASGSGLVLARLADGCEPVTRVIPISLSALVLTVVVWPLSLVSSVWDTVAYSRFRLSRRHGRECGNCLRRALLAFGCSLSHAYATTMQFYDVVLILRTPAAVQAFTHARVSLGAELSVSAGPLGAGHTLESSIDKSPSPVWSYMKSKGAYAGIGLEGTVIIERNDENA